MARAHAPGHVVPGGLPAERLIAWIIVPRSGDHLPVCRQAGIFERQGIARDRGPWQPVGCWTHLRRRFVRRLENEGSPIAGEMLRQIAALHRVEKTVRGKEAALRLADATMPRPSSPRSGPGPRPGSRASRGSPRRPRTSAIPSPTGPA